MVKAYNFLASWQLFPEKCSYENGTAPVSGGCQIQTLNNESSLKITMNWVTQLKEAFYTSYELVPDGLTHEFETKEIAEQIRCTIPDLSTMIIELITEDKVKLTAKHEILANGYLKITQEGFTKEQKTFKNTEVYHKQMSVLPYASSVGSVAVRLTKAGVIKHKSLQAMDEQTNMQLNQIREQIDLLVRQAQAIVKRKELSLMIYDAKLNFRPVIGHVYHLYQQRDDSYLLSMVGPGEWGGSGPFKEFITSAKLLADHTWMEV
jgi:Protein of unknown function (DUF2452)